MCACAYVLNLKYSDLKMILLKFGSELQKFNYKIPSRSEDINKIQTAFPRSGIFPRSRMHRHHPQSQLTLQSRGQVADQKYFIFTSLSRGGDSNEKTTPYISCYTSITLSRENYPVGSVHLLHF